ncbi:MAG: hypothetical protein ASARMPREDX12_002532 [Alectoria sarmentosa]|nr:MAG: hypothetical protein ASARMPREDX12_002532 [Alectoria sarmentosa]
MADPLTTSASIIAVIQISSAVISLCYQYVTSAADAPKAINWVISEVGSLKVVLEELKALENTWSGPGPSVLGEGPNVDFQGPSEVAEAKVPSGPSIGVSGTESLDIVRNNPPALVDAGGSLRPSILMQSTDPAAALNTPDTNGAKQINSRFELRKTATSTGFDHSALLKCLSATHGPLKTCESALQTIHHEISTPHSLAHAGRVLTWPLKEKAVQKILEVIQKQKSNLILALAADETRAIAKITESLVDNANVNSQILDSLAESTEIAKQTRATIQDSDVAKEREKIIKWLRSTDPPVNQLAAWERHEPNTGSWLLDSQEFHKWKTLAGQFAWLNGISGCGKTVLCASVIEHLKACCVNKLECDYAYYYVDIADSKNFRNAAMVQSLLAQLACQRESLPQVLIDLYKSHEHGAQELGLSTVVEALVAMLKLSGRVFLILDALDESVERELQLTSFVTSRREQDITTALKLVCNFDILIQSRAVDKDIKLHVRNRLQSDSKLSKLPDPIKNEICNIVLQKSDGMFRWATCQLDNLRMCRSPNAVRQTLRELPKTLFDTYDRILQNVPATYQLQVRKALVWLAYHNSVKPLTLAALAEVVTIDTPNRTFSTEDRFFDPNDLLLCVRVLSQFQSNFMEAQSAQPC